MLVLQNVVRAEDNALIDTKGWGKGEVAEAIDIG